MHAAIKLQDSDKQSNMQEKVRCLQPSSLNIANKSIEEIFECLKFLAADERLQNEEIVLTIESDEYNVIVDKTMNSKVVDILIDRGIISDNPLNPNMKNSLNFKNSPPGSFKHANVAKRLFF